MPKPILPTVALLAISAFGYYSILGLIERNGWGDAIRAAMEEGTLPDGEPIRTHYTGVAGLDEFLAVLVRFFYSCTTGERPALSAFTVYFAGQIVALYGVVVLEGLRAGNKGTILYFSAIWGLLYQTIPFGVTLPIYCAIHLWRSPLAGLQAGPRRNNAGLFAIDAAKLSTLPAAMLLGFVLPTALTTLPASLISTHTRQGFLALWQIFPLTVSIALHVLTPASRALGISPRQKSGDAETARGVYIKLLLLTGAVHITTTALAALPQLRRALLGSSAEPLDLEAMFRPMSAFGPRQIEELAEGTQTLLLYDMYCACVGASVWAVSLSYTAAGSRASAAAWTVGKRALRSLLVGPGGAVLWAFWDREEMMLAAEGGKKTE